MIRYGEIMENSIISGLAYGIFFIPVFVIYSSLLSFISFIITVGIFWVIGIFMKIDIKKFLVSYFLSTLIIILVVLGLGFCITYGLDTNFLTSDESDKIQTFSKREYLAYLYLEFIDMMFFVFAPYTFLMLFAFLGLEINELVRFSTKQALKNKKMSLFMGTLCGSLPLVISGSWYWVNL